ncbi:hypothetical protein AB9F35_17210 [Rhizobium leguminosarum]|uniref:hypothetical protein n=1 Tax=Rhizobium leguminosarum TaxID=384 RepID=UPI003F95F500
MKPYYHSIGTGMFVGTMGRIETQRQLTQDEHYLVFLPIPQKAAETAEEKAKHADEAKTALRNLVTAKIGNQESQVAFNRGEFHANSETISEEFGDQNTSDFRNFTYWVERIGQDLGTVRLESVLLRLAKPELDYVPELVRFVAKEGEKVRVGYLEGEALKSAIKQPHVAVQEIYSLF